MTIVSHVCAEFRNARGETIFAVPPSKLHMVLDNEPDEIREDPLYHMMLSDRSLSAVESKEEKKLLENDPLHGISAEGKAAEPADAPAGRKGRKQDAPAQ